MSAWRAVISGVASTLPTPEIKRAASAATAAFSATDAFSTAASAATAAFSTAASAASASNSAASAASVSFVVFVDDFVYPDASATAAARAAIYADAGYTPEEMFQRPLWHGQGPPEELRPEALGPTFLEGDQHFAFFDDWYTRMAAGDPPDWRLLERIALIPEETWKAGADAVSFAISEIEAAFLSETAPLAEKVDFNPDTSRFFVTPIPLQNAGFMATLMERTQDALEDALCGSNGLREDMREVRVLRRTHKRYGNDPQRVEMDYTSVAVTLRRSFDSEELDRSPDNLGLLEAVEEGARGLRAHHPEVDANRQSLAAQAVKELPAEKIELLLDAADVLPQASEGEMRDDFARDIPQLINDATTPLPSGAPPLPGMDEATRIFNRSAQMAVQWDGLKTLYTGTIEAGSSIFDSKAFKTVRLGLTLGGLLSAMVSLGLFLFGVL